LQKPIGWNFSPQTFLFYQSVGCPADGGELNALYLIASHRQDLPWIDSALDPAFQEVLKACGIAFVKSPNPFDFRYARQIFRLSGDIGAMDPRNALRA
jgi:hypothetical protein